MSPTVISGICFFLGQLTALLTMTKVKDHVDGRGASLSLATSAAIFTLSGVSMQLWAFFFRIDGIFIELSPESFGQTAVSVITGLLSFSIASLGTLLPTLFIAGIVHFLCKKIKSRRTSSLIIMDD